MPRGPSCIAWLSASHVAEMKATFTEQFVWAAHTFQRCLRHHDARRSELQADSAVHAQVKRWAAERPGWAITGMSLASSNFTAAPTGASTITRFLSPRVGRRTTLSVFSAAQKCGLAVKIID